MQDLKNPRKYTILAVGDSLVHGYGIQESETFSELLQKKLKNVTVINVGIPGHSILQSFETLKKHMLTIDPDLIIFSNNFNNRRAVLELEGADSTFKFTKNYLWRLLANKINILRIKETDARTMDFIKVPGNINISHLIPRVNLESFEKTLKKVCKYVSFFNKKMIFIPYVMPKLRKTQLNHLDELYRKKKYQDILKILNQKNQLTWNHLYNLKLKAKVYYQLDEYRKAKNAELTNNFLRSLHGGQPLVRPEPYNDLLKEYAKKYNFHFLELENKLPEKSFNDSIGHFSYDGHITVANFLLPVVQKILN